MLLKMYLSGKLYPENDKNYRFLNFNFSKDYYAFLDDEKDDSKRRK